MGMSLILCFSLLFTPTSNELNQNLDQTLKTYVESYEIAGLAAAIVKNNRFLYVGTFGYADINTRKPLTPDSIFHAASVSKPFGASAIMHLVERGKLDLDKPVITYLPYFKLAGNTYKKITLRQILTHHSGMPDVEDYQWDKPEFDDGAAERYVRSLVSEKVLGPPDKEYAYSNMAFEVLADVVHKVSGLHYEEYVKRHLLTPIGMKHSTFLYKKIPASLATRPHVFKNLKIQVSEVYPYNRRHAPSSTLNTNVMELGRWAMANLNHGVLEGKRILKAESYRQLFAKHADAYGDTSVALSWFLTDYEGHRLIFHRGGDLGYRSQLTLLPDHKAAVIILSNSEEIPISRVHLVMLNGFLGLPQEPILKSLRPILLKTLSNEGIGAAASQYHQLKKEAPEAYDFSMIVLYRIGYALLEEQRLDDAFAFFKINAEAFPESSGAQGALGEAYMKRGDRKQAIAQFEKAIELNPNNQLRKNMLAELLSED